MNIRRYTFAPILPVLFVVLFLMSVPGGTDPLRSSLRASAGVFPTFTVTNLQDSGAGSLRQAITEANATTNGIISFQPGLNGTITLVSALPNIAASMEIAGPGANVLTVARSSAEGTDLFRIFRVNSGMTVSISGLTMSNGNVNNATLFPNESGGGILNFGTLTVTNCVVSGNRANGGGGILNLGTLTLNNTTVSGNDGGNAGGGGIHSRGVPPGNLGNQVVSLTLNRSTVSGNTSGNGAGIFNGAATATASATLTISHSTISGNINSGSDGGGIYSKADSGATTNLIIENSTISGNSAIRAGGLFHISEGAGSIATATLTNNTITANISGISATGAGGITLSAQVSTPTLFLRNTIVAGNLKNSGATASDIFGALDSSGSFNLIGDGSGMTGLSNGTNGNQVGAAGNPINPRLAALANNGGPTQTHALLAGSTALDRADNTLATNAGLTTDQRGTGFDRIVDATDADTTATVDVGSFEAQVSLTDLADQTINEDSSLSLPFNVAGAITSVTATSSNTALVPNNAANISVSGSGDSRTLTINPVANGFGSSTITVTVNGANSQSMTDTFVLTVNPINDAPSFTKGPDHSFAENGGSHTLPNWATNLSAGPNESGQTLTFVVTDNTNPGLFSVAPAISSNGSTGELTYTTATGVSGTATITIVLKDDGGTANGGVDTSAPQSFNINVLEGGALAFTSATYSIAENAGTAAITVTRTGGSAGFATVLFTTTNGSATAGDYTTVSQTLTFNNGETSKTVNVSITNDVAKEADETVNLTLSNVGGSGALGGQTTAVLTIVDDDPTGGYLRFSSANYNTTENAGSTTITVERIGETSAAVTVLYFTTADSLTVVPCSTVNGIATSRCDYTTAIGTLQFASGETSKTFAVLISQDNYVEGPETVTLGISNPTGGAALAAPSAATLTIADDATEPATNPIDDAENFVRQHYHDFLNREPDASGLAFWSNQITECLQPGATCNADERRINVSAAFFLSIEFQETGYLVERVYKSAYGDVMGTSNFGPTHQLPVPVVRFEEFLPDSQQISKDVIVGVGDWLAKLEANKVAFTQDFVVRSRFSMAFNRTLTPAQFVDALFANTGVTPSTADRDAAIAEFGGAGDTADLSARARALRRVAENATLNDLEKNKAFVLMQYFGYLRRNPNSSPDTDYSGYDFWLTKLNQFNGNFVTAEMVKSFIISVEYRQRFGQ